MKNYLALFLITGFLMAAPAVVLQAQEENPAEEAKPDAEKPAGEEKKEEKKSTFKKYEEVITEEAETKAGLFTTHMVDDKLFYEIPAEQFGKEAIWVVQFSKVQSGNGWGGMPITSLVVRWERRGDRVLLRQVDYSLRAEEGSAEEIAVEASTLDAVLAAFDIVAFKDEEEKTQPVIDVTALFTGDLPELSPKQQLNAQGVDKNRTFINSVKSFPRNIETRVLVTYTRRQGNNGQGGGGGMFGGNATVPTATVEIHHSMVLLPENPMQPRIHDPRVGFYAASFNDFSKGVAGVEPTTYISRFRLEKKDPNAELSEPVQPIVWYVGRGVPEKWRKYVKEGIEMWQPAFEQAGFKNAIIAAEPPSVEEDPNWDAEDARYSTIRWLPSTIRNAFGPHIRDPRTGEILEADVRMFHDVLELGRNWYFIRASAADPDAQSLPFSDELMGKLLRYVVAHEVGHSIGLRHNHKSSWAYTVENLRDAEFTEKYGYQASIMDYSRFNYVAQPGDGAVLQWEKVGPYDLFAIEWGYKQFAGTETAEDDVPYLNEIAARQMENPMLLFGSYEEGSVGQADPFSRASDQTGEPMKASEMGLANLQRIMGYLYEATTSDDEDYEMLEEMHSAAIGQWGVYMRNVTALIGGIVHHKKVAGQPGPVFMPVDANRQRQALNWLADHAFNPPQWLAPELIIVRIGIDGYYRGIVGQQLSVINMLMTPATINRMLSLEATEENALTVSEMVRDVTGMVFVGLDADPAYNVPQRTLQQAYLDRLLSNVKPDAENVPSELRAASRASLVRIADQISRTTAGDAATADHLLDVKMMIDKALTGSAMMP